MSDLKVSICIPVHNQRKFLEEAVDSCLNQTYENKEIIVLDDASDDDVHMMRAFRLHDNVKYFRSTEMSGTGGAFNKAIKEATGDIVILLCADDVFTDNHVVDDIVHLFKKYPNLVHVTRYYYQFVDGDPSPVRAWNCDDIMELANNPSGLAFKREHVLPLALSNKMFVEASTLVRDVRRSNYGWTVIIPWHTVAVRIHKSISRTPGYYKKMWNSSPVEEWAKLGWNTKDFTHLIQVGVNFRKSAVIQEIKSFIKTDIWNIINPIFWFFSLVSLLTPRPILYKVPEIYRATWGRWTTRKINRFSGWANGL